jgi:hypothetical protein
MNDPREWAAWAKTFAKFPKYSPGNALLIMVQCPDASYVAGYRAWQSLGRQVDRGEKAIGILAPVLKKIDREDTKNTPDPDAKDRKLVGFRAASVFDMSQTSGAPLHIPEPEPLIGDRMSDALQHLIPVVGVPVTFGDTGQAYGVWSPRDGNITVRHDAPPNHQFKTLIHEWSHSLGVKTVEEATTRHRGLEEIIAETTAYVVAGSLGLDTSEYSKGYVGSWAKGDQKIVAQATNAIGQRVHTIVQAVEKAAAKDPVVKGLIAHWEPVVVPEPAKEQAVGGRSR